MISAYGHTWRCSSAVLFKKEKERLSETQATCWGGASEPRASGAPSSSHLGAAMKENREKWKEAADIEMEMLQQLGTWEKVDLPVGTKLIGTHWVFKCKRANGGYNLF